VKNEPERIAGGGEVISPEPLVIASSLKQTGTEAGGLAQEVGQEIVRIRPAKATRWLLLDTSRGCL